MGEPKNVQEGAQHRGPEEEVPEVRETFSPEE
jgi:hypothetical protein